MGGTVSRYILCKSVDMTAENVLLLIVKIGYHLVMMIQAVYFYQSDGRGPCLAFEGDKLQLHWYRGYMLIVGKDSKPLPRGLLSFSIVIYNIICRNPLNIL